MRRIEQFNDQLLTELAYLISQDLNSNNSLITLSYVNCAPNLASAKIGVSVLPETKAESAIKALRQHSGQFCQAIRKKLSIRKIPKFIWVIDKTESQAAEIEEILKVINKNGK